MCDFLKKRFKSEKNLKFGFAALVFLTDLCNVDAVEPSVFSSNYVEQTLQEVVTDYAKIAKRYFSGDLDPRANNYTKPLHEIIRKDGEDPRELSLSHLVTRFASRPISRCYLKEAGLDQHSGDPYYDSGYKSCCRIYCDSDNPDYFGDESEDRDDDSESKDTVHGLRVRNL